MSSGNTTTEYTRAEMAADEAVIREAAIVRNVVLRRALAIAAAEFVGADGTADSGVALMVVWIMRASDELEAEAKGPNKGVIAEMEAAR